MAGIPMIQDDQSAPASASQIAVKRVARASAGAMPTVEPIADPALTELVLAELVVTGLVVTSESSLPRMIESRLNHARLWRLLAN
jgi:hypothetical protein